MTKNFEYGDAQRIHNIIKLQLTFANNEIIKKGIIDILVEPIRHQRKWDYSETDQTLLCWTIAIDKLSGSLIIYSDFGYGPERPWGLISESYLGFGMDFSWYDSLQTCFLESVAASELPIWCVEKEFFSGNREFVAKNVLLEDAYKIRDKMANDNNEFKYHIVGGL